MRRYFNILSLVFVVALSFSACGVKNGYVTGKYGTQPLSGEIVATQAKAILDFFGKVTACVSRSTKGANCSVPKQTRTPSTCTKHQETQRAHSKPKQQMTPHGNTLSISLRVNYSLLNTTTLSSIPLCLQQSLASIRWK